MKRFISLFFLILLPFLGLPYQQSQAHSISNEPGGFTPGMVISDADFLRWDAMDSTTINSWLASKGSWLANYTLPEYVDVPYFCRDDSGNNVTRSVSVRQWHVSNYALYGMSAAHLFADRAKLFGMNPQVMLALLERESSGVTRSSPSSDFTRAWPLFYAFDEAMASYSYSCSRAEQIAVDYGGVGQQIAYGTYGIKNNYNNSGDWQSAITIDGTTFTPQSRATRALYRYTPHIHPGNHNFWYFFTVWFSTSTSYSPDALVRSGDHVYLADHGELWHIDSADAFDQWGFSWGDIRTLQGSAYANNPVRGGVGRLIRTSWGRVFYMEQGKKRPVMSAAIFTKLGLNWDDVRPINDEIIKEIPTGIPMWELTRIEGTPTVYFQSRGENHAIPNPEIFQDAWKFDWAEVADVPTYVVTQFPTTRPMSRLAKANHGVIFFLDNGVKYEIPSADMFNRHGFKWDDVVAIESSFLDNFPTRGTLRGLIKAPDGRVFYVENGMKRYVNGSVFRSKGFNLNDAVSWQWASLNLIPNGPDLK